MEILLSAVVRPIAWTFSTSVSMAPDIGFSSVSGSARRADWSSRYAYHDENSDSLSACTGPLVAMCAFFSKLSNLYLKMAQWQR
jgi:hypothetical protein